MEFYLKIRDSGVMFKGMRFKRIRKQVILWFDVYSRNSDAEYCELQKNSTWHNFIVKQRWNQWILTLNYDIIIAIITDYIIMYI